MIVWATIGGYPLAQDFGVSLLRLSNAKSQAHHQPERLVQEGMFVFAVLDRNYQVRFFLADGSPLTALRQRDVISLQIGGRYFVTSVSSQFRDTCLLDRTKSQRR